MWKMEINDLPRELKAKIIQGKDLTGNLNFHLWTKKGTDIFSIMTLFSPDEVKKLVRTVRMYVFSTLIS